MYACHHLPFIIVLLAKFGAFLLLLLLYSLFCAKIIVELRARTQTHAYINIFIHRAVSSERVHAPSN